MSSKRSQCQPLIHEGGRVWFLLIKGLRRLLPSFRFLSPVRQAPRSGGQDELNEFVQHAFLSIEQSEYEIRWQSHVGAYQSPNREQNLTPASHDLDADGNTDVVVGAPYYDSTDTDAGSVFAWFGSSSGLGNNGTPSNADEQIVGDVDPSSYTGFSVDAFNFPPYFRVIMEGSPGGGELNNEGAASINKWTN